MIKVRCYLPSGQSAVGNILFWSSLILLFSQTLPAKLRSYVNDLSRVSILLSRALKGKSPSLHCTLFLPQRYENATVAAYKIVSKGFKSFPLYTQPPHTVSTLEEPLLVLHLLCVCACVCVCKSFTFVYASSLH